MSESKAAKWDTSRGLDYSYYRTAPFGPRRTRYMPHEFPPLFKNTKLIGESDLEGRGDTFQLVKQGDYAYVCHLSSGGFSVVDVKDPTKPEVVKFIPTDSVHTYSIKCRVLGNILIVSEAWHFWEPPKYTIRGEDIEKGVHVDYHYDNGPKEPIETGFKIYDVSKPDAPKLLSFFKTGGWLKEGGGVFTHRFSFDGHYAYFSACAPGYDGMILLIVDLSNPRKPREVSRFWLPGQWIAGGERWPTRHKAFLHLAIPNGDRLYTAWFEYGGAILDISNIKRPTLISDFIYDIDGQNHTFLPIKDRQFAIFISEWRHTYMLDISDEEYPRVVGMFPKAPKELLKRGSSIPWGPSIHNIHENVPGPDSFRSDDIIYATCGPGGLRIYDVSDPYRIEEIGYYVPGTPKAYYDPRGPAYSGVRVEDVYVDKKGLIYTSGRNHGLQILEHTG